jgi:hypothetical protein
MTNRRQLRGVELRYALTMFLFQHGAQTVADLIDALEYQCFEIPGRASKVVSDALRAEIAHGRVIRLKRGRYGPGEMPRATEHRIHQRVLDLREEAAIIASQADGDAAFWDALLA